MEYEHEKMDETIRNLENEVKKHKDENQHLRAENSFFHQSTTIFINIKKLMDIEKQQYVRKMENEQKIYKKKAIDPKATPETSKTLAILQQNKGKIDDMIDECKEGQKRLEQKLKVVLAECRSLSKNQKQLRSDVTMSNNQTRIITRDNQRSYVHGIT